MTIRIRIDGELYKDFDTELAATDEDVILVDLLDVLPLRPEAIKCKIRVQDAKNR